MRFQNVCLEAVTYILPEEIVTSAELERQLAPVYSRLRLPEGRLELMTGIRQRRFWPPGTMPSQKSIETARKAMQVAGVDPGEIGVLVHGSVCRDYLEPATASGVHHGLGLGPECVLYDVSNACLGLMNGILQVAAMIELGQISAGLVVGTESSRALVETTIRRLNEDASLTRNDVKPALASLTIGSGSAAILLVDRRLSRTDNRLLGGVAQANTEFCGLCRSDEDQSAGPSMEPLMWTDSETLMHEGVKTAKAAFARFLDVMEWTCADVQKTFCHQVGRAHQKLTFETLGLNPAIDYATFALLGNTGSVALPISVALGVENGHVEPNDRVALMGIGSGINVLMLGVEWGRGTVRA